MASLDIGCGDDPRGDVCVDHIAWPGVTHVVNVGFEPLPFEDSSFDTVYAWDFFEHLPKGVHYREDGKWHIHHPHIMVFNEAWRVLKNGGIFDTFTPILEPAVNGRLFHFSTWNENQFDQFTELGTDYKRDHMRRNGYLAKFEIVEKYPENFGIHVRFRAIKDA